MPRAEAGWRGKEGLEDVIDAHRLEFPPQGTVV
jgi:hypothetical protein